MDASLCLAVVAFLEARGEPPDGMMAVMDVVLERVDDPRWPDEVCAVAREPRQFAFADVRTVTAIAVRENSVEDLIVAMALANIALSGDRPQLGATHFHSGEPPFWTRGAALVGRWGGHTFWRLP